eukprot:93128_1
MGGISIISNSQQDLNDISLTNDVNTYINPQTIEKRNNCNEIDNKNDIINTIDENKQEPKTEYINNKQSISINKRYRKSSSTLRTATEYIKKIKTSFSAISNSDTNKSVTFMLLDMTDDENNMNDDDDDDGYYEQDEILEEEEEDDDEQIT